MLDVIIINTKLFHNYGINIVEVSKLEGVTKHRCKAPGQCAWTYTHTQSACELGRCHSRTHGVSLVVGSVELLKMALTIAARLPIQYAVLLAVQPENDNEIVATSTHIFISFCQRRAMVEYGHCHDRVDESQDARLLVERGFAALLVATDTETPVSSCSQ